MFAPGNEDIMRRYGGDEALAFLGALVLMLSIAFLAVSCNGGGGNTYYYPRDTHHGYYDTHHHYHYYPKFNPHSKVYVKPKSGAPGVKVKPAPHSGGSLRKSGGYSSRRR